jgi:hypothetical protein
MREVEISAYIFQHHARNLQLKRHQAEQSPISGVTAGRHG